MYNIGPEITSDSIELSRTTVISTSISISIFVVIVFSLGVLCGCVGHRYMESFKASHRSSGGQREEIYSEVELADTGQNIRQQQHKPEMMENVAYGTLRS